MRKIIITKNIAERVIKEDPDLCYYNGEELRYVDDDAIPFMSEVGSNIVYIGYEGWTHFDLIQYLKRDDIEIGEDYRGNNYWTGRFWKDSKVISFWRIPDKSSLKVILDELSDFFDGEIDFSDYNLEVGYNEFINVYDYIKGEVVKKTNFDLGKVHMMKPEDKAKDPQMKNALKAKYNLIGKHLGKNDNNSREVSQAEYNFYKRYGLGESIEESPDNTFFNGERITFKDFDSFPFIVPKELTDLYVGKAGRTHFDILYALDDEDYVYDLEREGTAFHGRVWLRSKVISFWKLPTPQETKVIIEMLTNYFHNEDFKNYNLEVGNRKFMKVSDYIGEENTINNEFDTSVIHNLPAGEKNKTKQMKNALKTKYDMVGKKLGKNDNNSREVSQAEYNFYKRYGLGESVDPDNINLSSFEQKDELNPKLWVNNKLNSNVRLRLLDIVDDFLKECSLEWIKPKDIVLTGSMAGYNWSKYSDIDVHILIDYKELFDDKDVVEDYFITKKNEWNNEHDNLTIYGYAVEIFVQDQQEKEYGGVYSIEDNKWVKEPNMDDDFDLDKDKIKKMSAKYMDKIDKLEEKFNNATTNKSLDTAFKNFRKLFKLLKEMRKDSLKSKNNVGDIVYKVLRRTGYLDKLYKLKIESYDKLKSLD